MSNEAGVKVLVIGLDALTPSLVDRWRRDGLLPNISRFLDRGAWGSMRSVPNRNSAPAWSSMVTGLNPGKHGIYYFTEDEPGSYGFHYINASFRRGDPFWRILSKEGRRVGVANVPISYPAEEVNGFLIAGMDAPSVDDQRFAYPPELREEIAHASRGRYQVHGFQTLLVDPERRDDGIRRLHDAIDSRTDTFIHLMKTQDLDVFMGVYTESDVIQHFFWKHMEEPEGHPDIHVNAIRDVYVHLDDVVGRLIEAAGPGAVTMLISDHGGRRDDGLARALPSWLEQLGFLRYKAHNDGGGGGRAAAILGRVYFRLAKTLPSRTKQVLAKRLPQLREKIEGALSHSGIDWANTKAYTDGKRPEIWINSVESRPHGIVKPDRYDDVCDEIAQALTTATSIVTGEPIVTSVLRRDAAYSGPFVHLSPDLIVDWDERSTGLTVTYPDGRRLDLSKGHLKHDPLNEMITGGHARDGVIGLLGPQVAHVDLGTVSILDFAPSLLFVMDAPIPEDLDGSPLVNAFDEPLRSRRPKRSEGTVSSGAGGTGYSAEDEAEIGERLRSLGYVE